MDEISIMQIALDEAKKGAGLVSPNPLVGAVLTKNNKIVAKGFHGEDGKLHAERVVVLKAKKKKINLDGSILYVTLEPCCHYGKTPPCTDILIQSGIKKVFIAQLDPNPLVRGKGIEILKKNGIECELSIMEEKAKYQIRFYRYWIQNKLPYFFAKLAISRDGFYAQKNKNILISDKKTKLKTKELRNNFDAILVGKKTLKIDNPKLNTSKKKLIKIIFCKSADFPVKDFEIFKDNNVMVACKEKKAICDFSGKILIYKNLIDFKKKLFDLDIQSVLVEGGGELLKLFLDGGIIQELMIVKSKNVFLKKGLRCPDFKNFSFFKKRDFGKDVLNFYYPL